MFKACISRENGRRKCGGKNGYHAQRCCHGHLISPHAKAPADEQSYSSMHHHRYQNIFYFQVALRPLSGAVIARRTTPTRPCFGRASRRRRHSPICRFQEAAKRNSVRGYPSFPNSTLGAQGTSRPYRARLLNSAGFSFTLMGRGGGSRELFSRSLLGTADAAGATNLAAHRCSTFL
jgi:hypothetical protein